MTAVVGGAELSDRRWFALQVKARWESSTSVFLTGKGYETFLPQCRRTRWGSKARQTSAPLFPGYVFCQFDPQNRLPILLTPGVISVVGRGRIPVPLEDAEIASIQALISSGGLVEPWPYLEIGQRIRIEDDCLKGIEGILINFKGSQRIVVSVSLLRRSVALEIDRCRVRPTPLPKALALESVVPPMALQGVVA